MLRLYDYLISGNGYKVRLLLHLLGIDYELVEMDLERGETRTGDFLEKNPNGRIPLLELEDGTFLAESNAIQYYLARDTEFFPKDRLEQAQVMQWMFFEQYSHEPYIAVVRKWVHFGLDKEKEDEIHELRQRGYAALVVMQQHLEGRKWFVGDHPTIADIALYAYTHVAHEGGFDLSPYPSMRSWISNIEKLPNYVPITQR